MITLSSQKPCPANKGFTLIEMMIVVAMVAILTTVAVVAYTKYIKSGKVTEAETFVSMIQAQQERYFQRFGQYCDVSSDGQFYPQLAAPEPQAKNWDSIPAGWTALGLRPENGHSYFAFFVRASDPTSDPPHPLDTTAAQLGIPSQPGADAGVPHPWYYIFAHADLSGDDGSYASGGCANAFEKCSVLVATSSNPTIRVYNRGM
ncbi:MAG: prepilin-type N-terminal cleavage/methylation domain-containing protein [Pseudomonadota bacterium]